MNRVIPLVVFFFVLLTQYTPLTATSPDRLFSDIDTRIRTVQALTSFGRPASLHGLDNYVTLIEMYLEQYDVRPQQIELSMTLAEKLFSPLVYRDGSERSRIFQHIQHSLLEVLYRTQTGRVLLVLLAQKNPIVQEHCTFFRS
jgi:hypothetical protein